MKKIKKHKTKEELIKERDKYYKKIEVLDQKIYDLEKPGFKYDYKL